MPTLGCWRGTPLERVDVELRLHAVLLPQLGLANEDLDRVPVSPTTLAYTSYLLASTYGGTSLRAWQQYCLATGFMPASPRR